MFFGTQYCIVIILTNQIMTWFNTTGLLIYMHKIIKSIRITNTCLQHPLRKGVREKKKTKNMNVIGLTKEIECNNEVSFAVEDIFDPWILIKLQPYNKPAILYQSV